MNERESCENCAFSEPCSYTLETLRCRRAAGIGLGNLVTPNYWCGNYREKKRKKVKS